MQVPVFTRWWTIVVGALLLLVNYDAWLAVANSIINSRLQKEMANEIASYLKRYLTTPELKAQFVFLVAFHELFWNKHMEWYQHIDSETKENGFLSLHMSLHAAIAYRDLKHLQASWRDIENLKTFIEITDAIENEGIREVISNKMPTDFFDCAIATHLKHFDRWHTEHLHLALCGDHQIAVALSRWTEDPSTLDSMDPTLSYVSAKHATEIKVKETLTFLLEKVDRVHFLNQEAIKVHSIAIG